MEQGSSERSPPASSNQKKQLHNERSLAHELNPLLHSSSQDLPVEKELTCRIMETSEFQPSNLELLASSQRKQTQQAGTSFSRAPLRGELPSQFHGGYQDLPAAYLHGSSHSHDQPLYNLQLSNLPPEFYSLPSSSRLQGEHIGSSQTLVQFGSSVDPSIDVSTQKTYSTTQAQKNAIMVETLPPSRLTRNQGMPYLMNTSSGFDLGSGSSSNAKSPTTSALKRKMIWQGDRTPTYRSWNPFGRGYQRYGSRSFDAIGGRYTLYDKRYEDIGLPVDPHLRIFNATNANGNGESSTKKN